MKHRYFINRDSAGILFDTIDPIKNSQFFRKISNNPHCIKWYAPGTSCPEDIYQYTLYHVGCYGILNPKQLFHCYSNTSKLATLELKTFGFVESNWVEII